MKAKKYPGVKRTKSGRFEAGARIAGKYRHLGTHGSPAAARAAILLAQADHHDQKAAELRSEAAELTPPLLQQLSEQSSEFNDALSGRPDAQRFNESLEALHHKSPLQEHFKNGAES